jgi:hypothetical protein
MNTARSLLSATAFGCMAVSFMFMIGCASMRAVGEPPVETASPPPVVDSAPSPPTGPPPGYVKPENYWVREKIILGEVTTIIEKPISSEPAPPGSATPKSSGKKGKKTKKTGSRLTAREVTSILEAMHIEDPTFDHMAYRDANALKDRLSFGERGNGKLLMEEP